MLKTKGPYFSNADGRWVVICRSKSFVPWARIVYQNYYLNGEEIPKGYVVHHKNGDCQDDRPSNLELLKNSIHSSLHNKNVPKTFSPETIENLIYRNKHKIWTEEEKLAVSKRRSGVRASEETKRKMSEKRKGKKLSEEHCNNIGKGNKGKVCSHETREKLRLSLKGKPLSEEHLEKVVAANKRRGNQICPSCRKFVKVTSSPG